MLISFVLTHANMQLENMQQPLALNWLEADESWGMGLMGAWLAASADDEEPPLVIMYAFRSAHDEINSMPFDSSSSRLVGEQMIRAHTTLDQIQDMIERFSVIGPNH